MPVGVLWPVPQPPAEAQPPSQIITPPAEEAAPAAPSSMSMVI